MGSGARGEKPARQDHRGWGAGVHRTGTKRARQGHKGFGEGGYLFRKGFFLGGGYKLSLVTRCAIL